MSADRIAFLSNIPTPYQLDFLDRLSELGAVRALFLDATMQNHDWSLGPRSFVSVIDRERRGARFRLLRDLERFRPDAVLVGGYRLPFAEVTRWWARARGARFYYWLEKPLPSSPLRARMRELAWRARLPRADGVAAIGGEAEATYARFARRTLNLPYSIEVARYAVARSSTPSGPLRFLYVGQLIPRKGIAELLEAFSSLARPETASLTLAGSGELRSLVEQHTKDYANISYRGHVAPDELPRLFGEHDVFVAPSRHDGWAVVVCEAMASGMPVIGTRDTGAFVELVRHRENGYECEVSPASIRAALEYYTSNLELVREHGSRGATAVAASRANAPNAARALREWIQT